MLHGIQRDGGVTLNHPFLLGGNAVLLFQKQSVLLEKPLFVSKAAFQYSGQGEGAHSLDGSTQQSRKQ